MGRKRGEQLQYAGTNNTTHSWEPKLSNLLLGALKFFLIICSCPQRLSLRFLSPALSRSPSPGQLHFEPKTDRVVQQGERERIGHPVSADSGIRKWWTKRQIVLLENGCCTYLLVE